MSNTQGASPTTSVFDNGMLWLGAAISIAEILTGTFIAPLGLRRGVAAVLLGHLIGCSVLFFAGYIGALTRRRAMDTVRLSFGKAGGGFFAVLNVIQLVGWTAIMIASGADAAQTIYDIPTPGIWCVLIAALIITGILIGIGDLGRINVAVVGALAILTIVLSVILASGGTPSAATGSLSFGAAVELSAAMSISWLPVISDYTSRAAHPLASTVASCVAYFIGSCWMFIIGMVAVLMTGQTDIAAVMLKAGLGVAGILIVILSTVTTTFLDTFSAGQSCSSLWRGVDGKPAAAIACVLGMLMAIFLPVGDFEGFLYFIGSVFAPMASIMIVDHFIFHRDYTDKVIDWPNALVWVFGFILYRLAQNLDTPVGYTFPVMLVVAVLCLGVGYLRNRYRRRKEDARGDVHAGAGSQASRSLRDELRDGQ